MPALGSVHRGTMSFRDQTNEIGRFDYYYDAITALSIGDFLTQNGAFTAATVALVLGENAQNIWTGDVTTVSNALPDNPAAQRESKLLVQYQDTTTEKPYTLTIPSINYDLLHFMTGAGDNVAFLEADGATDEILAWVTAFEALCSPPDAPTHNVAVIGMRFVGRNT